MSYDLNILVLQQDKPLNLSFQSLIELKNETQEDLRYYEIWKYMTGNNGIWYCLGKEDDVMFSALPILEAKFGLNPTSISFPYWISSNEDITSNLVPLSVLADYRDDFIKIVKEMIEHSPIKTILFLARMQGGDDEIVCGVLSFNDFWELHNEGKILFNVCYIIRN